MGVAAAVDPRTTEVIQGTAWYARGAAGNGVHGGHNVEC